MLLSEPTPTWTSRMLVRSMDRTLEWSRRRALATSGGLFAAVAALDYVTGAAVSLNFLYLTACAFSVWCLGKRGGFALSLLGAVAAGAVKHFQLPQLLGHSVPVMVEASGLISRMLSFALFAVVVNGLRSVLLLERWRASHDGLTTILNKAGFEQEARKAIARAQSRGDNLLLAFMDLDGFKQVNDTFGHGAGDRVLQVFAIEGREAIRPNDLFARFGGDEFAALLTVPGDADGARTAQLLHDRFTAILTQTGFDVTCSMGASMMIGYNASVAGMIEEVDGLLYEVKRSGKNGLRLGQSGVLTGALQAAFPPQECDGLDSLLHRIDLADKGQGWSMRSAA